MLTPELFPRTDGTTYVCAISSEEPLPADPAQVVPDPGAIARLEAMCRTMSPVLASAKILARQACYRPVTRDGLPLIGPVPGVAGAYVATGHSVWGILNAPATGEAMAELIVDGAAHTVDLAPFDPAACRASIRRACARAPNPFDECMSPTRGAPGSPGHCRVASGAGVLFDRAPARAASAQCDGCPLRECSARPRVQCQVWQAGCRAFRQPFPASGGVIAHPCSRSRAARSLVIAPFRPRSAVRGVLAPAGLVAFLAANVQGCLPRSTHI